MSSKEERSASAVARALIKRSTSINKRNSVAHTSHVIPSVSHVTSNGNVIANNTGSHVTSNGHSNGSHVTKPEIDVIDHVTSKGEETDEGESTAGEEGISFSVESSTTDNFPDRVDPIDFIETNPRLTSHTHHPHSMLHGVGGGREGHRYENWSMLVNERELEELTKRNKISKRTKSTRGGKVERQRPPHPLPRLTKLKSQHIRPSPASRKRRLSGRMVRPPQLSNASEEGDMAQADEMGEGKDDGFVDCQEGVRKRNRKKAGGVHMLLPNGSPPSSPSNTPVSRRRASSRKSRPKPRTRKHSKPQLASADISTQESTTQGPGSTDTSEEGVSPHEGAVLRPNEDLIDSDSGDDLYEDARSLTPHLRDPPLSNQSSVTNHRDDPTPTHVPAVLNHKQRNLDRVSDLTNPSPLLHMSSKDSIQSNSDDNFAQDSNGTSDTDRRRWKNRRFESDLSTAPFSSETSDMDTSGNERILTTDMKSISETNGPPMMGISPHHPHIEHRQINSESSGDEFSRRARDVKIVPRPPPKPVATKPLLQPKAPPPAKKPLHLTKSSPMGQRVGPASTVQSKASGVYLPTRTRSGKAIPNKPKPPIAVKPKPETKPRPLLPSTQQRQTKGPQTSSESRPNGIAKPRVASQSSLTSESTQARPSLSPTSLRKIQSEADIKKQPLKTPPTVANKAHRHSNTDKPTQPPPAAKPSMSHRPSQEPTSRPKQHTHVDRNQDTSQSHPSLTSEDNSKNSSSSETVSSQSNSNSPYPSPASKKKPATQHRASSHSPSLVNSHTKSSTPQLDHSQSVPALPVASKPLPAPPKPPKDTEKREKSRSHSTDNDASSSPPVKPRRQSSPLASELTNGFKSPSPPPLPPRSRDSQIDPDILPIKDVQAPSPIARRPNRRPPPNPPKDQTDSKDDVPPPVPAHSSSRLSMFSNSLNVTQIGTIQENYEVCDIEPEQSIEDYYRDDITKSQPVASHVYSEVNKTRSTNRSKTPDAPLSDSVSLVSESHKNSDSELERYSTHAKLRKKMSTTRRTPPRPPVSEESSPRTESSLARPDQTRQHSPAPLSNEASPSNETPPPLPSQPIPRRKNRPLSHAPQSHNNTSIPHVKSSPVLGNRQNRRSVPVNVLASVQEPPKSEPPTSDPPKPDPPKRVYQRARRDYEEIDLLENWEGSIHCQKEPQQPKTVIRPLRRDYEEIDLFDDPLEKLHSDVSSLVPNPTLSTPTNEIEVPVSPITMVAVTRQTNSSTIKINPTENLPLEDLRENWSASSSPQLPRRQAKSFSAKRGKSLMYKRSSSDRFMEKKGSTLDPSTIRNVLHRTSSLDGLNDRMDRSVRNSMHREVSSSDEEENSVMSPTQLGLPKIPSGENLYSSPRAAANVQRERLEKSFEVNPEPLYQYINTAEFLRDNPGGGSDGDLHKYVNTRGKRNQLEVARQLSQRKLWCEQPEVIDSGILSTLSNEERKLQEAIFEVITTEVTYLRSLDVLIKHFMEDPGMNPNLPEGRRVMDKRQHHVIFSNVREVREVSGKFLDELQRRQRESAVVRNISDIILDYAENRFDCYVRYCTNQVYQTREMQDCLENNVMFRDYLRRLEMDKICQNLNMQSFLLLPMQRITRLPLLVLAILNRTPLDHRDHHIVERTLRTVQKLVTSCNDGARKMERTEQLVEIHKRLEFGKLKPFPLVSASRQLERKGTLVELQVEQKLLGKIKIKKAPLYVFVFTDYVIITKRKKDPKGDYYYKVIDHASRALVEVEWIESHHGVNFEKQMFGEAESVSRATWAVSQAGAKHAFLVILLANAYQRCAKYLFLAQNDTDKTRWMESMERQDVQKDEEKIYQMWDCPQVQAIFDYHGQQPDELDLQRGDVVKVYRKMADGWYEGERLRDLRCGWFPSNFCSEIENEHTRARNLRETHRLMDISELVQSGVQSTK